MAMRKRCFHQRLGQQKERTKLRLSLNPLKITVKSLVKPDCGRAYVVENHLKLEVRP